eukprot:g19841.t1
MILLLEQVCHSQKDFFVQVQKPTFLAKVELIWDNPPYTGPGMKEKILEALVKTNKPFCVLLPSSILHSKLLSDLTEPQHIQVIFPRKVYVCKTGQAEVAFKYLVWLCYKMKLKRDIYFVGES